jgi:hypothetical protein
MECQQLQELEQVFVETRRQWLGYVSGGRVSAEEVDRLSDAELKALLAVFDHRAEHGCEGPAEASAHRLPPRRNIGGIIGPY